MTCRLYSFQANHHGSRVWLGFKKLRMEVGQQQNNATTTGCYEIRFGRFFRPPGVQLNVVHLGAAMSSVAKALLTL